MKDGVTGFVAHNDSQFIGHTARLLFDAALRTSMGREARNHACREAWDDVFSGVYEAYETAAASSQNICFEKCFAKT